MFHDSSILERLEKPTEIIIIMKKDPISYFVLEFRLQKSLFHFHNIDYLFSTVSFSISDFSKIQRVRRIDGFN